MFVVKSVSEMNATKKKNNIETRITQLMMDNKKGLLPSNPSCEHFRKRLLVVSTFSVLIYVKSFLLDSLLNS